MKTWILRQEWNEKEYDKYLAHVVKLNLEGLIEYEIIDLIMKNLPNVESTEYLDVITDNNYKVFCQKSKEIMRARKAKYYVITKLSDGSVLHNDGVLKYLYATLNINEVQYE